MQLLRNWYICVYFLNVFTQMQTQIITTDDGSHSLFVPHLNEHYHSTHGAIQESRHVYINAGFSACTHHKINVLEIGFGTGLNAFLTLLETEGTDTAVNYTSLEFYPLDIKTVEQLNYSRHLKDNTNDSIYLKLHTAHWNELIEITPNFSLHKIEVDFSNPDNLNTSTLFDVIYFDAFGPDKQPEMWNQQVFDKLYAVCNANALIVTYCAKGSVRRMLQKAGFAVERLPGPPGKREILRGVKIQ